VGHDPDIADLGQVSLNDDSHCEISLSCQRLSGL
jgi:hypothetical protein